MPFSENEYNDLLDRNKELEMELKSRHHSIIQLTEQVQRLTKDENIVNEKALIIAELTERVRQLDMTNLALLEKNQDEHFQWKQKEKHYNDTIAAMKSQLSGIHQQKDYGGSITELQEIEPNDNEFDELTKEVQTYQQLLAEESIKKRQISEQLEQVKNENLENAQRRSEYIQKIDELTGRLSAFNVQYEQMSSEFKALQMLYEGVKTGNQQTESLESLQQKLLEKTQEVNHWENEYRKIQQRLHDSEKQLAEKEQKLQLCSDEYRDEMQRLIQINEKKEEKALSAQIKYNAQIDGLKEELLQLRKELNDQRNSTDQERMISQSKQQQLMKQYQEMKKQNLDLEYKIKDIQKTLEEKTKIQMRQLEILKYNENEVQYQTYKDLQQLKQAILKTRQLQEQMNQKDEQIGLSNLVKNKLIMDNQEIKQKTESQNTQIAKLKSSVVSDLKKTLQEKETEVQLVKEVVKSTKIMIKVKDSDITRLKQRVKQLETENLDLITRYQNLEGIFQDILLKSKNKHSSSPQIRNNSKLLPQINPQNLKRAQMKKNNDFLSQQSDISDKSHPQEQQNIQTYNKPVQVMRKKIIDTLARRSAQDHQQSIPLDNQIIEENQINEDNQNDESLIRNERSYRDEQLNTPVNHEQTFYQSEEVEIYE